MTENEAQTEEEPRKLSDVVIGLENDMKDVLGLLRSLDTNVKLLLNSQNMQRVPNPPREAVFEAHKSIPRPTAEAPAPGPTVEAVDFPQAFVPKTDFAGRPRTVQEKLYYASDSKVILLAQIEIFDEAGKLVNKTRTNNQGAWTARLAPGAYKIRVAKTKTSTKPQVLETYNIMVTSGEGPLPLESRKL
jgi:hypothetical protein